MMTCKNFVIVSLVLVAVFGGSFVYQNLSQLHLTSMNEKNCMVGASCRDGAVVDVTCPQKAEMCGHKELIFGAAYMPSGSALYACTPVDEYMCEGQGWKVDSNEISIIGGEKYNVADNNNCTGWKRTTQCDYIPQDFYYSNGKWIDAGNGTCVNTGINVLGDCSSKKIPYLESC
jgi:hypothetical protein